MGSLPPLSVIQGDQDNLRRKDEPILLHRIIEHTIQSIESINNNNEKIPTIHGINLRGGEPCFVCGDKRLSLGEVNERANQLARSIQQNCVPVANNDKDIVISVEMKPSIELVMTLMAIWKAGAAYLPLDEAFPDDRVRHIICESKPSLLITDRGDNPIRFRGCNVTTFQGLWAEAQDLHSENLPDESSWMKKVHEEDRVCAILYTSGSTGVPKGVRLPHCTVVQRLKWQWKEYPFSPTEDFCLFKTALTFVDSIPELWGAVLAGKSILILQKSDVIDIQQFVETLDQYKVERIILVPSLLRSLLFYIGVSCNEKTPFRANEIVKRNQLTNLKIVVCSGETLPVQLAQKFYQFFPEKEATLLNFFGSTETMGDVLYYPVPNGEKLANCKVIPIGRPMYNCNIYLLDKNMRPVRKGTVGELYASGAHIALGYVNNREPERFLQNSFSSDPVHSKLYRTGDYARWENDVIIYEGRTDSQIKIRGHKVDLSEVSSALAKIPLVEKYAVLCYNAGQIDQALVAFITAKKVGASANEIEEQLEAKLPPYMIPNIQMVDQIPLLVNGKVDRQTLLREYGASRKNQSILADFDYNGIRQDFIKKAKAVFEAVAATLGGSLKKRIDAATDYYSLGGNSLNSIIAVTTLKDLGYSISIGDFVKAQNMLEIIEKIEEEERTVEISMESLSKIDEGKYTIEIVRDDLKEDVIRIITESFFERGDLERCLSGIKREDYRELVEALWSSFMEQQLSYVVKTSSGESVACALNLDANLEPELHLKDNNLTIIFTFLEHVEGPFRENVLPKGTGQIFHSSMMGTAAGISTQQNVELMMFMEHQNMEMARKKGFAGVFTTNTSPLTQQLGTDVFKFKVLRDYQANKYEAEDGTRPFETGPNSLRAVVSWKPIH